MKRTFGKNIVLFILIVLFTLCMAVGCTTLKANPLVDNVDDVTEWNTESSIKLEASRKTILPTNIFTLTITAKLKNDGDDHERKWGSAEFNINTTLATPDDLELVDYWVPDAFYYSTSHDVIRTGDELGFIKFTMAANSDDKYKKVPATEDLVVKLNFKYKDGATVPADKKIKFEIKQSSNNYIGDYDYTGSASGGNDNGLFTTAPNGGLIDKTATGGIQIDTVEPKDDATLALLSAIEGDPNGQIAGENPTKFVYDFKLKDDEATDPINYTHKYVTARASKDAFYIYARPNDKNAEVEVIANTDTYHETTEGSFTYKIPLVKSETKITINVTSYDDILSGSPEPATYTIDVTQIYLGLSDKTSVTTDETVSVLQNKKGISEDTPIKDGKNNFDILVPTGEGGATQVELNAILQTGYGVSSITNATGTGCTVSPDGTKFTITEITDNAKLVLTLENEAGIYTDDNKINANQTITFTFKQISVEVGVTDFTADYNDKENNLQQIESKALAGRHYRFILPKESGYKAVANVTVAEGATYKFMQDDQEIAYEASADNKVYTLVEGEYELVVTAAAGNTKTYTVKVENEILAGQIVYFDYSLDKGNSWTHIYDKLEGHKEISDDSDINYGDLTDLKDAFKFFQLKVSDSQEDIYFRIAITDNSKITGLGTGENTDSWNDYTTQIFKYEGLKLGNNKKTVDVAAKDGKGSNTYHIEIVKQETEYNITNIEFDYTAIDGEEKEVLVNFATDFIESGNERNYKHPVSGKDTVSVRYATSQITIRVTALGESTVVFINGIKMSRTIISDENGKKSLHTYTLNLRDSVDTPIKITYAGTDGIETSDDDLIYNIPVRREPASSENKLSEMSITLYYTEKKEDGTDEAKEMTIPFGVKSNETQTLFTHDLAEGVTLTDVLINAKAESAVAKLSTGNFQLGVKTSLSSTAKTSEYKFSITVIPENSKYGSNTRTYTIQVTDPSFDKDKDNTLKSLEITGSDGLNYVKNFSPNFSTLEIEVPYTVDAFRVSYVTNSPKAQDPVVSYNGKTSDNGQQYILEVGANNVLTIVVNAQDVSVSANVYTITIKRAEANKNNALSSIEFKNKADKTLLEDFNANTSRYDVKLETDADNDDLTMYITSAEANAKIKLLAGDKEIASDVHELYVGIGKLDKIELGSSCLYTIIVEIDGFTRVYTINVTRADKVGYLDKITFKATSNGGTEEIGLLDNNLKPTQFNKNVKEYWVEIDAYVNSIEIIGAIPSELQDNNSSINIVKTKEELFANGTNSADPIKLIVKGLDGVSVEYIINVIRTATPEENTDATITIDEIAGFKFDNMINGYNLSVDYSIAKLNVNVAVSTGAKYAMTINGVTTAKLADLKVGENTIEIVITAANKVTKKTVKINVTRKHAPVQNITATNSDGSAITTDFDIKEDTNKYSMKVSYDTAAVNFAVDINSNYSYRVSSNANSLVAGDYNTVTIEILDKNNSDAVVRTIEVEVFREAAPADYTMWYIIAGVLGGIALILLIIAIIAFTKGGGTGSKRRGNINDIGIGDYELD